jgi:hypothetical protein
VRREVATPKPERADTVRADREAIQEK